MASVDMCEHDWPGTGCKECFPIQIKRYDWHTDVGCMIESEDGGYVESSDYDDIRMQCGGMEMEIDELREENARLLGGQQYIPVSRDLLERLFAAFETEGANPDWEMDELHTLLVGRGK